MSAFFTRGVRTGVDGSSHRSARQMTTFVSRMEVPQEGKGPARWWSMALPKNVDGAVPSLPRPPIKASENRPCARNAQTLSQAGGDRWQAGEQGSEDQVFHNAS